MKKVLSIVLAASMAVSFGACAMRPEGTAAGTAATAAPTAAVTAVPATEAPSPTPEATATPEPTAAPTATPVTDIGDIEDTVLVDDDLVKITLTDIDYNHNTGTDVRGTMVAVNKSGRALLIASEARQDNGMGQARKETDEKDFPAGAELTLSDTGYADNGNGKYTVYVFDPNDKYASEMDENGTYYNYRGTVYLFTVTIENGQLNVQCKTEESSEFAYTGW